MECANSIPKPMATMERNNSIYWKHSMTFLSKSFGSIGFHLMADATCTVFCAFHSLRISYKYFFSVTHVTYLIVSQNTDISMDGTFGLFSLSSCIMYESVFMYVIYLRCKKNNMMFCLGRHRFNHAKQWTFLISVNCDNFMWFVKFSYVFFRFLSDVLSIRMFVSNSISKWNKSSSPPILCDDINWFFYLKHQRAISSHFRHCLFITINVNMSFLCAVNVCRLNFLRKF